MIRGSISRHLPGEEQVSEPSPETIPIQALQRDMEAGTDILHTPLSRQAPQSEPCLVHIYPPGPTLGRRYPIGPAPMVIGRFPNACIVSTDPTVSAIHLRIERRLDGFVEVEDLESTNGTFVNHVRVKTARLSDGCYLQLGGSVYRYLAGGNIEAQYHEGISRLSMSDPLTGLLNRQTLDAALDREVGRAVAEGWPLALIILDVDRFKQLNDRYGHLTGDELLRALVVRFLEVMRGGDILARYGGEEFAVLLPRVGAEAAVPVAERLRRAICEAPFVIDGRPHLVTVSAGVGSLNPGEALYPADLLRRTDGHLYDAKHTGRNRVCPTLQTF